MGLHQASDAANRPVLRRTSGWRVPLYLTTFAVVAAVAGASGRLLLRYDRTAIAGGELWRLITGHFVHLGAAHLLLNIAGLAVIWLLVGSGYGLLNWIFVIVFSLAFIDLGFWFFDPGLSWYVGMSGLLHALLTAGIVQRFRDARGESLALLLLVTAKIAYEQIAGPLPGSEGSAGGPVVVNAHLYGAIAGLCAAVLLRIRAKQRASI